MKRAVGLVVLATLVLVGCDLPMATAGARCPTNGKYAQDGTYVMKCVNRRWKRGITVATADAALNVLLGRTGGSPPASSSETVSQRNARQKAADYLRSMSFSRTGLIEQLKYEGFNDADATYGVDAQGADWNAQAAKKAAEYLSHMSFSHSGLVDQLVYEGFTQAQAEYGVSTTGL